MKTSSPTLQSTFQVLTRLNKLNDLMDSFGTFQDDIIELDDGESEDEEYSNFQDTYCSLKADIEDFIAKRMLYLKLQFQ